MYESFFYVRSRAQQAREKVGQGHNIVKAGDMIIEDLGVQMTIRRPAGYNYILKGQQMPSAL